MLQRSPRAIALRHRPLHALLALGAALVLLQPACKSDGDSGPDGTPGAGSSSTGAAGKTGASAWQPRRGDDDGMVEEPDWFAACDIGETTGACDWLDSNAQRTGTSCLEWAGGMDLRPTCGEQYVLPSGRCQAEDAVAICVSGNSRTIIYDPAMTVNLEFACSKVCRAPDAPVGDGSCDRFLRCVCGSVEPQEDDDASCLEAREVIAAQREMHGASAADSYCANLLNLEPDLKDCGTAD